jgi:GAF domain-containing protein
MTDEALIGALERLAEVLQAQPTLGGALASIAETATTSVPGCDAASIAISIEGRPFTAAGTARVAFELDMVQYDTDDGPCLTSFRSMSTIRLYVSEPGDRFPHIAVAAERRGVRAVLSVPAVWGAEVVATLNLYSRRGPFDQSAESVAAVLAAQVAMAVSRSPEYAAARAVVEEAQRNTEDDADINVATGLLMVSQACTAEQAAGLLRQAAIDDERDVLEIAHRIIEQHRSSH